MTQSDEKRGWRGWGVSGEGRTAEPKEGAGGLYLNCLGSIAGIHTWDKHCHPEGLSHRHLTGTCFMSREGSGEPGGEGGGGGGGGGGSVRQGPRRWRRRREKKGETAVEPLLGR